jgi:hypothetical protein
VGEDASERREAIGGGDAEKLGQSADGHAVRATGRCLGDDHENGGLDLSSPFVDAVLPDGSRLHVVIPDITREHWAVNIRKFVVRAHHLDELVELGTLPRQAARFLEAAVAAGLNVLISGGTQAGKTTLLKQTHRRMYLASRHPHRAWLRPASNLYRPRLVRDPKRGAPRRAVAGSKITARRAGRGYGAPRSQSKPGHPPKVRRLVPSLPVAGGGRVTTTP